MSYILEALRKSDQERQRGAAPTLLAAQATTVAPTQPALLAYGLLALVLLGAGVAIGWLRPWQAEQAAPAVRLAAKPTEPAPKETAPNQAAPVPSVASVPTAPPVQAVPPAPARVPERASKPELAPKSAPQARLPGAAPAAAPVPLPVPTQPRASGADTPASAAAAKPAAAHPPASEISSKAMEPAPTQRGSTGSAATATAPSVVSMAELPLAIQQELPVMSITVHAYSARPAERLIGVDNRMLREGAEVAPGLTLESITPDGMILSYKGYRFRRGVH